MNEAYGDFSLLTGEDFGGLASESDAVPFSSTWLLLKVGVAEFGVVLAEFEAAVLFKPNGFPLSPAKKSGNGLIVGIVAAGDDSSVRVALDALFTQLLLVDCGRDEGGCCCCCWLDKLPVIPGIRRCAMNGYMLGLAIHC